MAESPTAPRLRIRSVSGADILPHIDDAARLRIAVFREYPYLYEGDMKYERRYLRTYSGARDSLFVLALDGDRVVGVSTGVPMGQETAEVLEPFQSAGIDPSGVFYFGESVLLPEYRGLGIGVRFFEERERYARGLPGITLAAFCAVDRPADHPMRPADFVPLDRFWEKRGFRKSTLRTEFSWKETGEARESAKPLTFWLKSLV